MRDLLPKEFESIQRKKKAQIEIDLNEILAGTSSFPIQRKRDEFVKFHETNKKRDMIEELEKQKAKLKAEYERKILELSVAVN